MHLTNRIVRPPFESRSTILQVTSGCSHNKCKFCNYYNNIPFKVSPIQEVYEDLNEIITKKYSYKRIWLQSANPFTLPTEKLLEISKLIKEYQPQVESIGCYSRVDDLTNKTIHNLKSLKKEGYNSIVIGVESGDNKILEYMNKGYTFDDVIKQVSKLDKAGIKYTLIFLSGLGGQYYSENHAKKTAQLFNNFKPERIMINQLQIKENTQLSKEQQTGKFKQAKPEEINNELITFLEKLKINTFIDATNNTNNIPFFGKIQENKENIIRYIKTGVKR